MRLLLDTNAFLWTMGRSAELSAEARRALDDRSNDRFVSVAAAWEITIKVSIGKLALPGDIETGIDAIAATMLPITMAHVVRVQTLPRRHRDPFDRMMIAQAMEEGLTIVTRDRQFQAYGVTLLMT